LVVKKIQILLLTILYTNIDGKPEMSLQDTEWKTQFYGQFKTNIAYADNAYLTLQTPTTAKRQVMARDTSTTIQLWEGLEKAQLGDLLALSLLALVLV
jgi:hypothetical protein